jgi:hypothetical protein
MILKFNTTGLLRHQLYVGERILGKTKQDPNRRRSPSYWLKQKWLHILLGWTIAFDSRMSAISAHLLHWRRATGMPMHTMNQRQYGLLVTTIQIRGILVSQLEGIQPQLRTDAKK